MDKQAALTRLKLSTHEGWRLVLYDDATGNAIKPGTGCTGNPTIAAGVNLDEPISNAAAEALTMSRIDDAVAELDRNLAWWRNMDETRQQVLFELCFMLGWPALSTFSQTLSYLSAGNPRGAAEELAKDKISAELPARMAILIRALKFGQF